ncbi:hypothetical protein GOP47_0028112 [Adiantum capillus-veneris]|nr:hypothetical protein GOP47_0028112 [Adiantum capillus-veneris]
MEISVTISVGGDDIDVSLLSAMQSFLENETIAGLCAIERGGDFLHLHFQMIVQLWMSSLISTNKRIKQYLGWDKHSPSGAIVLCRGLKQRNMHTFEGTLGYCLKDHGKEHFQMAMHNVDPDQINRGVELYSLYGGDELKKKVYLIPVNIFNRAFMLWKYKSMHPLGSDFLSTLHKMLKTGRYYPSSSWVTPYQGRGMELGKTKALWRCIVHPSTTTYQDVISVFINSQMYTTTHPLADWFLSRWQGVERCIIACM